MSRSRLHPLLVLGAVFAALLVPLEMIGRLIAERAARQQAVVKDIAASGYGRQALAGPILNLPYTEEYEQTLSDAAGRRSEIKRVRALQANGVIVGFHAEISPAAIGLHLEALITIRLHAHARGDLRRFQAYVEDLPATQRVYFLAGDRDFLVHVAVPDAAALRELVSDTLSLRPEVASTSTSLIFAHAAGSQVL